MPLYEYKCSDCGFMFDRLVSNSKVPNPSCPRWLLVENNLWMTFFLDAEAAFKRGQKIEYPGAGLVGPEHEHTIVHTLEDSPETETHSLADWIKRLSLIICNGETERLVSLNSFQLKGGGWEADGY